MIVRQGRPHTLMQTLIDQIRDLESKEERCVVLVPSQYTLQAEKEILTRNELQGTFYIDIISPGRLKSKVFDTAGYPAEQALTRQGKAMLLKKVMRGCADELRVFGQSARSTDEGIVSGVSLMISNFKKSGLTSAELNELLNALPEESGERKKLSDLALIYSEYEQELSGFAADDDDMMQEMLRRLPRSRILDNSHLIVYGFDMITPDFAEELLCLSREAKSLTLYIETDRNSAPDGYLFAPVNFSLSRLENSAIEKGLPFEKETIENKTPQTEIEAFSRRLYAIGTNKPFPGTPDVGLSIASTPEMEVKRTAAEIRKCLSEGYTPDEIAVVYPKESNFESILPGIFQRNGLSAFVSEKRSAISHPLSVFLIRSLNAVMNGWQNEDLLEILASGFTNTTRSQANDLYRYAFDMQIKRGGWKKPFTYDKHGRADRLLALNEARELVVGLLETLEAQISRKRTGTDFADSILEYLEAAGAADRLEEMAQALREAGMDTAADDCVEIWNKLMDVLDQVHILLGKSECESDLLCGILSSAFSAVELSSLPPTENTIQCGSIGNIRLPDVRMLFMIGMNDTQPGTGTELFTPEERQRTEDAGKVYLGMDLSQRRALGQLDLLKTMLSAKETVRISYASADSTGKAMRPDPVIGRIRTLLPSLSVKGGIAEAEEAELYVSGDGAADVMGVTFGEYLDRGLKAARLPEEKWNRQKQAYDILRLSETGGSRLQKMIGKLSARPAGRLYTTDPHQLYSRNTLSITRLERYAGCPYAEFIESGLKPENEETAELERNELGEIYHKAAELFTNELTEQLLAGEDPSVCDALMERTVEPLLEKWRSSPTGSTARGEAVSRRIKRAAKVIGQNIVAQYKDGGFKQQQTEFVFGEKGISPLILRLQDGSCVYLKGRIDRIDLYDAERRCIRIIDYKTRGKKIDSTQVYWGLQLQLFIYLAAALEHYIDCEPGGIFYCPMEASLIKNDSREKAEIEKALAKAMGLTGISLSDIEVIRAQGSVFSNGKLNKDGSLSKRAENSILDARDMTKVTEYVKGKAAELAQAMYSGKIERKPCKIQNMTPCEYCEDKAICGFEAGRDEVRNLGKKTWSDILGSDHD